MMSVPQEEGVRVGGRRVLESQIFKRKITCQLSREGV